MSDSCPCRGQPSVKLLPVCTAGTYNASPPPFILVMQTVRPIPPPLPRCSPCLRFLSGPQHEGVMCGGLCMRMPSTLAHLTVNDISFRGSAPACAGLQSGPVQRQQCPKWPKRWNSSVCFGHISAGRGMHSQCDERCWWIPYSKHCTGQPAVQAAMSQLVTRAYLFLMRVRCAVRCSPGRVPLSSSHTGVGFSQVTQWAQVPACDHRPLLCP